MTTTKFETTPALAPGTVPALVHASRFDMLIYRLFWWRWNRIFAARLDMWAAMVRYGYAYWEKRRAHNENEGGCPSAGSDSFDPTLWRERVYVQDTRNEDNEVWIRLSAANAPRHTLPMARFAAGQTLVIEIKHDPLGVHNQNAEAQLRRDSDVS